ncbi:MAG: pyruvate kinase alpha/beta domain-containing protein [Candidatus Heimdallarchaeota archaeon]
MTDLSIEVTYFEKGGPQNTDKALEIAKKYADQFNIKDIVIASTTGTTAEKSLDYFNPNNYNIIVVTHSYYFAGADKRQEFPEEKLISLNGKGLKFFIGTHGFAGPERSIRISLKQWGPVEIMAKYLRTAFSQGVKVCMEMATMVVDAGLLSDIEKDIICVGGTGRGADTVCLIKPMPTSLLHQLRVKAILAKPV